MNLSEMFEGAPSLEINDLSTDSRKVCTNSMFFCLDGLVNDGHKYVTQAIQNGAICIVHSKEIKQPKKDIAYIRVENVNATLNRIANRFYGAPSTKMKVFGITGTNGKTTVASIIRDVYSKFEPCGYIGTISTSYGDVVLPPTLTTPDTITLHSTLNDMVTSGMRAVALEVSSHGLELGRVNSIDFDIAVFTNLTHDHLDFHGTIENYFDAKKKLFRMMKKDGTAILNADDACYEELCIACSCKYVSYGITNAATYHADNIKLGIQGSTFDLTCFNKTYHIETNLVALYNIYNLVGAIAALSESGLDINMVITHLNSLEQIDGRLESINEGQPFHVIVDFAHTPDGLEKIYEYAKMITTTNHKIISVFGSAGKRDTKKRKTFGEVSSKYANTIILTEDDPRDESPKAIADEIKTGITNTNTIFIEDRYDAIRQAIEMANVDDTVLILGKGDELFMHREFGKEDYQGDHNVAREVIRKYYLGVEDSSYND
ncbi:MAG: UDP-N-acetylmuramoyl-L-alanyl-D-glutamate--2,6-diaminopimelate ligase [Erysipelotrichaceae bacterium]